MKNLVFVVTAGLAILIAGCKPTASDLQSMLEKNPEILTNAIEKNPEKMMAAIQKAAQVAQGKMAENAQKAEKERVEAEWKTPLQPNVPDTRPVLGNKSAPILIVEYTDFECPFCARGYQTLEQVRKTYGDKVKLVVKNLPLPNHQMAVPAARRFEALMVSSPEKAWKFYHEVFTHQADLNAGKEKYLDSVVKKVGGDVEKVKKEMESEKVVKTIQEDMEEAQKFGFSGTPGFIVAGISVRGAYPFDTFKEIIDRKLAATN